MSYQRGAARDRWPIDARARVEWLEKEVARLRIIAQEQEQRIYLLTRPPEPHVPYRDTLTLEQRTARPALHEDDSPEICALRRDALYEATRPRSAVIKAVAA
ncbi:hypothetical protein [Citricoccus sp. NR2]|uniref:hypothetical protein n=1 Tax=Citricoccus sp. NR2 TaxID=3004095 RepID=UPI0022DDF108|nr:hypothetical protein [Citricoccus sp. NR2]WBL18483.1 hypothetical protein O1A05_12045 [Citricoccus sp. NR2]